MATGDRSERNNAQRKDLLTGKILRLVDDGSIPDNNPFVKDPDVHNAIYALGVRNPQGLYFDRVTNKLFETEHGPMGGDEVNIIEPGRNYGWPVITYGSNYTTQRIGVGTNASGFEQPLFYYLPSVAISPITVYRGEMFPEWEGDLLVGPLKGKSVNKLDLVDGTIKSEHRMLKEMEGRIRDIKIAADGSIYFLLQRGGRIYRLYRDQQNKDLEQPLERKGKDVYQAVCASCHSTELGSHPQLADAHAWRRRLSTENEVLVRRVTNGYGDMPPKGGCDICSDKEIRAAVRYLVEQQGPVTP